MGRRARRPPGPAGTLRDRARAAGILPGYRDLSGRWRTASRETLSALLRALENGPDPRTHRASGRSSPSTGDRPSSVPPVIVVRGEPRRGRSFVASSSSDGPRPRVLLRSEGTDRWVPLARVGGGRVALPDDLPYGCHDLRIDQGGRRSRSRLVIAPRRLPSGRRARRWGVFAPMYALRDEGTWGCGDLTAFEHLGEWAAAQGASVLATLPLLPAFLDRPYEPSPYRPVSRRFWNELYLDPRRTEEFVRSLPAQRFVRSAGFRRRVTALERRPYVDFRAAARLKRGVLERMLRSFDRAPSRRRIAFRRFVRRTVGVREYARFRASLESDGPRAARYHLFVQWLVDEQLREVASRLRGRGVDLFFDLPLGVDTRGFDAQQDAPLLVPSMSTGSPPDPGVPGGQNWGFPPWHPRRLRDSGYRPWVEALAHHFSVAHLLRIDHALGLHRVFWIPGGEPPANGGYVRFPAEELYAVLVAEAARAGARVVGEDLGTVPPELRPALRRNGLLRLFVAQLEWVWTGPHASPPRDSVASLNTHDHPPFASYWNERLHRRRGGKSGPGRFRPAEREWEAFRHATETLARSRAYLMLVNVEDLWGEHRSQNVPGRAGAEMFSRRFRVDLRHLRRNRRSSELLSSVDSLRRGAGGRMTGGTQRTRRGVPGRDGPIVTSSHVPFSAGEPGDRRSE